MATETELPLYLASTDPDRKVMTMLTGYEDVTVGRMSVDFDPTEFDVIPRNRIEDTVNQSEGAGGDELDLLSGDVPPPFRAPPPEPFPILKSALRHFRAAKDKPRVFRVDTDETFGAFVCEKAVDELARRLDELQAKVEAHGTDTNAHGIDRLRARFDEHVADPYAHQKLRQEVLGAAQAITDLRSARSVDEALDAMQSVPLDVPEHARGAVRCWKDGDSIVCSIRFAAVDGSPRLATMAARPRIDEEDVAGWAARRGVDPVTILGAARDVADVACAKKLLRDVSGAALRAQRRLDVCGMGNEPVVLVSRGGSGSPELAAIMHIEQRAQMGDRQAAREMTALDSVGAVKPLIAKARQRLSAKKVQKSAQKMSLFKRMRQAYYLAAGWA